MMKQAKRGVTARHAGRAEIGSSLKAAGVQPTAQRIAICQYVLCEAKHPTADQVKAWADKNFPKISLATVYNTLNVLVGAGLLKEFKFPHSDKSVYDNNVEKHFHFLNEETGELIDIPAEDVKISTNLQKSMKITDIEVVIKGTKIKR